MKTVKKEMTPKKLKYKKYSLSARIKATWPSG